MDKITIVGAGLVGRAWAVVFARAGILKAGRQLIVVECRVTDVEERRRG